MHRTAHVSKTRHPRRQSILGLTPAEIIAKMTEEARGVKVRKVRGQNPQQKESVLPPVRTESPAGPGEGGVPGAVGADDHRRAAGAGERKVPEPGGTQLSRILKRMLGEVPPRELMDLEGVAHAGTNAEALAAVVMAEALKGKQWAIECVRDQTEGKPVRAAQVNNSGEEVEEMLDRVSAMRLNTLAGKK